MRARSAGRLYSWLDNVGARVRDGLHASRGSPPGPRTTCSRTGARAQADCHRSWPLGGATSGGIACFYRLFKSIVFYFTVRISQILRPPWTLDGLRFPRDPSTPGMDLGLFEKSNRPFWRGGRTLFLLRKSNRPSKRLETPS